MSGDEQIHRADGRPFDLKLFSYAAIGPGCDLVKSGNLKGGKKLLKGVTILGCMTTLADPIGQFSSCDTGNTDVTDRMREEAFKDGGRLLFDEVDADVGIQHHLHVKEGFRF